jgi:hypothetical protein
MAVEITAAAPVGDHRLHLQFADGCEGDVDVCEVVPLDGVFTALRDPAFFAQVYVDRNWGTVCWPGDLDLAAEPLWERITGRRIAYGAR